MDAIEQAQTHLSNANGLLSELIDMVKPAATNERSAELIAVFEKEVAHSDFRYLSQDDIEAIHSALLAAAEAREATKLTKAQWIERYGGQAVLDREGFDVVPCVDCGDSVCHGWRVERRTEAAQPSAAEVIEAAERALLQVGQWDAFTQREKGLMKDALALIGDWKEAHGGQ